MQPLRSARKRFGDMAVMFAANVARTGAEAARRTQCAFDPILTIRLPPGCQHCIDTLADQVGDRPARLRGEPPQAFYLALGKVHMSADYTSRTINLERT